MRLQLASAPGRLVGGSSEKFATAVDPLRKLIAFSQALLLREADDGWVCTAAMPETLRGMRWASGAFFSEAAAGRISITCGCEQLEEWREAPRGLIAAAQPALYLPVRVGGERGLLILLRSAGEPQFADGDIAFARRIAASLMAACATRIASAVQAEMTELRRLVGLLRARESDLVRRAYSDDLTGLANRPRIEERVNEILRAGTRDPFALAFIDLDNFKHVNDYYNHAVGDALLVKVARCISSVMRETDMLARISGDEFLLLLHPIEGDAIPHTLLERLLAKLKQPFHIEGFEVFTSASIGVSKHPEHGRSYEELRRNADTAMYRAKSEAKGAAAFFDRATGQSISARMQLEQRLRLAIQDRRFCCAFQPKIDIRSREVVGFETLVRWRDDNGELEMPVAFVGLAVELGLIDPITQFVLGDAVASLNRLDSAFGSGTSIAINVAARQAGNVPFMRSIIDRLQSGGHAHRFIIEVTEDAFIAKNRFQMEVLPMLREAGVRVSIDDFGTGYSSLSVLADITADEIKIDRSFIADIHKRPRSQSILRAIESVSDALGISVIAEGVECFEELAYLLATTRIRYAQGYHFAKPFLLEELAPAGRPVSQRVIALQDRHPESRVINAGRTAAGMRCD